ncbi:RluA family pseudouridine synthase [Chitinivibrio alkaliphilus]|uniref:Pseudouridine synthase n=1 Tax=Chitinivibrio alkaliphilus ACht1 TaxID=1313304 RepID=U7DCT5_9BACT|nr:RluA family pseudouridine synthase [Chitinivibrio alkaliphilus]ERP38711.1 pseudouridine synthase, RluA family [Chitinivibrio alkaliphilus ACht1]
MEFRITPNEAEIRLDVFLSHLLSEASRTRIQTAIQKGQVLVNGKKSKKSCVLWEGDLVSVLLQELLAPPREMVVEPEDIPLDIVHEDAHIMVLNKPAGQIVHPGNGNPGGTILNGVYHYLRSCPGTPRLIHRLDKDTSGILLVAKNEEVHEKMSRLFMDRQVYKGYLGICLGRYPERSGRIEAPLGRSKSSPIKRAVRQDGRAACTDYALLRYRCGISAMAFRIHTGRTHQIRVHSAYAGFPIVRDDLYLGDKSRVKLLEPMERPFAYRMYAAFSRQALHSRYISFVSPFTQKKQIFTAPLQSDFSKAMTILDLSPQEYDLFERDPLNE